MFMTGFRLSTSHRFVKPCLFSVFFTAAFGAVLACAGQAKPAAAPKPAPAPDVLTLSDGDTLHGKLVSEVAGMV